MVGRGLRPPKHLTPLGASSSANGQRGALSLASQQAIVAHSWISASSIVRIQIQMGVTATSSTPRIDWGDVSPVSA